MSTLEEDSSISTSSASHQPPQAKASGQLPDDQDYTTIQQEDRNPPPLPSSGKDQSGRRVAAPSTSPPENEDGEFASSKLGPAVYCNCRPPPDSNRIGRNLVVCIDGTANQFSFKNSNVVELYSRLVKDETQLTYYNSGIGTFVRDSNRLARLRQSIASAWDMAVAWNLKKNILSAYRWLSENYQPGDRIFLFGFSRGAYQVRIIAGMISTVGLLHKGNDDQIEFAYELYLANVDRSHAGSSWLAWLLWLPALCFTLLLLLVWLVPNLAPVGSHNLEDWLSWITQEFESRVKDLSQTTLSYGYAIVVPLLRVCHAGHSWLGWFFGWYMWSLLRLLVADWPLFLLIFMLQAAAGKGVPWHMFEPFRRAQRNLFKGIKMMRSRIYAVLEKRPLRSTHESESMDPMQRVKTLSEMFKETLSHEHATVHLVGVWDTVSSVGVTRGQSFPETVGGMTNVCGCRHAVSLDECRDKFLPEYINAGAGPSYSRKLQRPLTREEREKQPGGPNRTKEVWFVGSHSDIGGGNSENIKLDSFGPSLRWMLYESLQYGLKLKLNVKGWGSSEHKPSMTLIWRLLEILPFRRLTYQDPRDPDKTENWSPHLARGRRMQEGQLIHQSVIEYMRNDKNKGYTPVAWKPRDDDGHILTWDQVRDAYNPVAASPQQPLPMYIERDADSPAIEILKTLRDAARAGRIKEELLKRLEACVTTVRGGSQAIIDTGADGAKLLLETLQCVGKPAPRADTYVNQGRVVSAVTSALALFPSTPSQAPRYFWPLLQDWLGVAEPEARKKVVTLFGSNELLGHTGPVLWVVYSPNGDFIASGSRDNTIRLWDAQTGHPIGEPLRGHTGDVTSVAFSPDGTYLASGSDDRTIRIWDVATQQAVGSPLIGHGWLVLSVAFSPDGKHVISGSLDETVRIWEVETGRAVGEPLRGHTDPVLSVAVSPDGRRIASGSWDRTVRIWDFATREVVRVLKWHSHIVASVVFTPDGKRVVSGSRDNTIRVWDIESGETVLGPLLGHERDVNTVAVSSDGKYIVSGSDDMTVRLWNAETGEAVGEPLRGHTDWVRSVAFSPDGRRVVSGSLDKTLMIWDVDDPSSTTSS